MKMRIKVFSAMVVMMVFFGVSRAPVGAQSTMPAQTPSADPTRPQTAEPAQTPPAQPTEPPSSDPETAQPSQPAQAPSQAPTETQTSQTSAGEATAKQDIIGTATAAGNFTILTKALQAAGLVDTLKGAGPYTVFAPTDDAFNKLPAGALDALMKDPAKLKKVLLYHVVQGNVTSEQVMTMKATKMVEGSSADVMVHDGKVMIDKSMVTTPDVVASNGVIHVIDTVLMP